MLTRKSLALAASAAALVIPVHADILGYYPLDETNGTVVPNVSGSYPAGTAFPGANWVLDATRGPVLSFNGAGGYANLGDTAMPAMTSTNDFTWSFWSYNEQASTTTNVIVGNRYPAAGGDPLQFVKFTNASFEFYNGGNQGINYVDQPQFAWVHNTVIKNGNQLTYFRDGRFAGASTFTFGTIPANPIYLGGDKTQESWQGRLDDVALWDSAVPAASVARMALTGAKPNQVRASYTGNTVFSDDFSGDLSKWNQTNRGLENNAPAGYNAPQVSGGTVTLSGTTNNQYWYGSSLESIDTFGSTVETLVSVDRVSLSGVATPGSAYRSSLWIYGDAGHYLHFSQNVGEGGWTYNFNDVGGLGSASATGIGINIPALNGLDNDQGFHTMSIEMVPTGQPGDVLMYLLLDGNVYADQLFTNFPDTFQVILTGQGRATGDSVSATFDNAVVQQVPEPAAAVMLLGAIGLLGMRRRRA